MNAFTRIALFSILGLWGPAASHAQSSKFPGQLGAMVEKSKDGRIEGTTFRVWAPNAESVSVTGSFNNWNDKRDRLEKEGDTGIWSADVRGAKPGDEYMFVINGELERKDPRARQVTASDGRGVVYDTTAFDWGDTADFKPKADLSDLVIYQLHPGTFHDPDTTDDNPGTLRDAIDKLDHLKDLGINCILLMPVNEFHGRHSWGYNPSDQFAVESSYGGPDALKEFVKACHERGIAVHLDVVHNHYGPQDLSLWQFDGYGGGDTKAGIYFYEEEDRGNTPWGPRPNFGRPEVRDFIADQIRMWFDEYKIDGLRWDSVINIRAYNNGADENPEGEKLLHRISRMIRQEYPGKVSIAEDSVGDPRFDSSWEYHFHHGDGGGVVPQLIKSSDAAKQVSDIGSRLRSPLGFRRVIYTENHDETGRLNGKRRIVTDVDENDPHSLTARRKHALAAVLTLTTPGIPLVFMGQELLEDKEFHDSNPLDWQRGEDAFHAFQLFRDLIRLRRNLDGRSAALTGTHARVVRADETAKTMAYRRYLPGRQQDDIYVIYNFSGEPLENFPVVFPKAGEWTLLLNTDDPKYGRDYTGTTTTNTRTDSGQKIAVNLAPYSAQIFGLSKVEPSVVDLEELRDEWEATHAAIRAPEPVEAAEAGPVFAEGDEGMVVEEVPFQTDVKKLSVGSNFMDPMAMTLVEDHIWQADFVFTNGRDVELVIINPLTGRRFGATGAEPGVVPVNGSATEDGAPILLRGPLNGDYSLTFNEKTMRYRFEKRAASRFGRLNIVADFNNWSRTADPLHMVADHTWQAEVDIDRPGRVEFAFMADGSLEKQWGDEENPHPSAPARGTATEMAGMIRIETASAGPHRITFNEETGEYAVEPLDAGEVAPLPAVPAPQPVTEIRRVRND